MKLNMKKKKTIIKLDEIEIKKQTFQQHKNLISIENRDINN